MELFPLPAKQALIEICTSWHSGQTSAMYSVSSTGTIYSQDTLSGLVAELRDVCRTHVLGDEYNEIRTWYECLDMLDTHILEQQDTV